ncbi:hypothetical protein GH714_036970 [Hevea brasiliensis]|uniref:Uncharacterized protein n=1 Tax=Hevea brasiliensis TaxID=3981 RepID=A0A6A6MQL4_HEVBR|nr:hypothetical protein GH714_036970 [Hevea brasiliensis]
MVIQNPILEIISAQQQRFENMIIEFQRCNQRFEVQLQDLGHLVSTIAGRDESLKSPTCVDLVNNCPKLTSLALRGFKLHDCKVRILVKGFRKLSYVDFSTSYSITGNFLRNLGGSTGGNLLEVLILRDCMHLKEVEVARLLMAVIAGDFKFLRHLDVSNREGLASEGDWYQRCYSSSIIPIKQVLEARPDICLLAEFPPEGSLCSCFVVGALVALETFDEDDEMYLRG